MKSKSKQSSNKSSPFINHPNFQVNMREQDDSPMDWSADTPHTIPQPHVPTPQGSSHSNNMSETLLDYGNGQPADASSWDGAFQAVSLFGTKETSSKDAAHIHESLVRISNYIKNHPISKEMISNDFVPVVKNLWNLFDTVFASNWDVLLFDREKALTIRKCVGTNFAPLFKENAILGLLKPNAKIPKEKPTPLASTPAVSSTPVVTSAPPPPNVVVPPNNKKAPKPSTMKKSYVQASKANISNIDDVIQIKEAFPSLSADEVGKMLKAKNSGVGIQKPKINMTTKGLLRKEVIIPMAKTNAELIINSAYIHTSNTNNCLKNSKSDTIADFICLTHNGIIITTNKLANSLDLSTIEKYLKNIKNVNLDLIESPCLPKSKLYMKIIGLSYITENGVITPDFIERVLKNTHLFKDIVLALKPCVIKASPKSDMVVIWVDIWDSQSSSLAKNIINYCFNVGHFIATI